MSMVRFNQIARECRETFKGSFEGKPIVGLEHIEPYDMLLKNSDVDVETTFTKSFKKGQILFGRRRAYQHKACVATCDGICSGDITVIEPIEGAVYPDLLPFIIQNDEFFEHAIQGSNGALSPRVKWEHMANFELNLPSITEQKVLAEKLWAAYEVKQSYLKMIDATDEIVKAQFVEMFNGINYVSIDKLVDTIWGASPESKTYNDNMVGLPFYQGKTEFGDMYINEASVYCSEPIKTAEPNDILMSVRAPVGTVNIAKEKCCIGRGLAAISPKKNKSELLFIFYALKYKEDEIAKLGTGSTFKAINKDSYAKIKLPDACKESQLGFVSFAEQADRSKAELRKSIDAIDKVIKSLINENL